MNELPLLPDIAPELVALCEPFLLKAAPGLSATPLGSLRCWGPGHLANAAGCCGACEAGLVAIPKPNKGVRPIAVGELR